MKKKCTSEKIHITEKLNYDDDKEKLNKKVTTSIYLNGKVNIKRSLQNESNITIKSKNNESKSNLTNSAIKKIN